MRRMLALLLCCGGFAVGATERVCLQPTDRIVAMAGCDTMIQNIAETLPELSAYRQSLLGPSVMLWPGGKEQSTVDRFPALIQAARQYPNIKSVYLMDEWGWQYPDIKIGLYETEVLWAAKLARSNGLKTVISITPDVILHPDFAMRDINAFDLIGIISYPRGGVVRSPGCTFDGNHLSTALYCSYIKLLNLGYRGRIGYIAQGFADAVTPHDEIKSQLTLQQETIRKAFAMRVDAFMVWGLYRSAAEASDLPVLIPLGGTEFEPLLSP